jgi:hypothetical protein
MKNLVCSKVKYENNPTINMEKTRIIICLYLSIVSDVILMKVIKKNKKNATFSRPKASSLREIFATDIAIK